MKNNIKISIPYPCHKNWQEMTPVEKGRFCASCQTKVVDFHNMTDNQITVIANDKAYICGRFKNSQLNREIYIPKEKKTFFIAANAALVSFLALGSNEAIAQTPVPIEQQPVQREKLTDETLSTPNLQTISGTVTDITGLPIPGAIIKIKGRHIEVQSDFDGNYSIDAEHGDDLEFYFVGYKTKTVKVNHANIINITLVNQEYTEITIGLYFIERPTFFGRIFRKIGNLFKKEN